MHKKLINNKNKIILFFLITLVFKPLWLFNNQSLGIPADDMSYWLHSATLAFDQDLNYLNDYKIQSNIFNSKTNVPSHPPGAGYLAAPFVFLFSQLDKVFETTEIISRTNPVKSFAYVGFFVAGLFYTYFGSVLLSKLVKKNKNNTHGSLLLFCGFMSTLVHFVSTRFLMAHSFEFFLCSTLLYIFEKEDEVKLSSNDFIKLILTYFCLAITRPSTFLYSLILILLYRKKFKMNLKFIFIYIFQLGGISSIYVFLSRKLYQKNFMLLNTYGSDIDEYSASLNFEQLINGLLKLPNLFISTNMGVAYSTPIVFIALILFFTKYIRTSANILDKLILFLYFGASLLPLLIWQGREVAYGQRLLIGIIPICVLITSKYFISYRLVVLTKLLTLLNYIGYILFYSSEDLTLKPGITLWGTQTGFTAENYYFEVLKAFLNYETLISALLRNIYSVNIFKFFNLNNFINDSMLVNNLSYQKVDKFLSFAEIYNNLDISYIFLVNLVIIIFSYLYMKLILSFNE